MLGGAVTAAALSGALTAEPDLMHTALDTGTLGEDHLTILESTAERLGMAPTVQAAEPADLLAEAVTAFRTVRGLLTHRQRTGDQVRLVRTAAKLAKVAGDVVHQQNLTGAAACWYRAGYHASRDAGDRLLADIALASHAYIPAYAGDARGVLAMIDPRLGERASATPAVAFLWASKAKAHAMLGERDAFARCVDKARTALGDSSPDLVRPGSFSFTPQRLAFYETTGHLKLRDSHAAMASADRALATTSVLSANNHAAVRLERATAMAQTGEAGEACRAAASVLLDPRTHTDLVVMTRAREFDVLVRASAEPAVRDWRDALASRAAPA